MFYVYVLRSIDFPDQIYIGFTINPKERLATHNRGSSSHTAKYKPWALISYHCFKHERTAIAFEKYLKSHSGRAFTVKRLL